MRVNVSLITPIVLKLIGNVSYETISADDCCYKQLIYSNCFSAKIYSVVVIDTIDNLVCRHVLKSGFYQKYYIDSMFVGQLEKCWVAGFGGKSTRC